MSRLIGFFLEEQSVRWKVYLISSAIAFAYAVINLFALHRSEGRVSIEAVILQFMLVTIFVVVYVSKGEVLVKEKEESSRTVRLDHRLVVAGAVAALIMALISHVGIPRLQAEIIDLRLVFLATRMATVHAAPLSDYQLQTRLHEIKSIVETTSRNRIPVDPVLLMRTQSALSSNLKTRPLSDQTKQMGFTTAIDLQSLAYTRQVQTGAISPRQIANTGGYMIGSPVAIDKESVYFQGQHSWFALAPSGGQFVVSQSNVVFDSIDFQGFLSRSAIELKGDNSSVLVRDSILDTVTQNLDKITWVDVRFEKSRILYRGGPLKLRNVSFKDCDLSHLGNGSVNVELARRITNAAGQPLTFVYEP